MFDKLKDLVKHYAGEPIINNPDIPNERNEEAVDEASHAILNGLKKAVEGGRISDLTDLLKGDQSNISQSPLTSDIQGGFVENLTKKFGLDHGKATQIATTLIPVVLKKFAGKASDSTDNNFDLTKIIAGFTGGDNDTKQEGGHEGGGLLDKLKGLFN